MYSLLYIALLLLAPSAHSFLVASDGKPSLAPMLEDVTPAVVNIATEGKVQVPFNALFADPLFRRFFGVPDQSIERKTQSLGSGVIVDAKRGLVLTNNHVIANASQITVTLRDGRQLEAELVGTDPATDVAVIKIPIEDITAVRIADSDALRVGDFVVAIGNPFGLGQTVTSGIISALGRSGLGIEGYEDFIQTDASINPGNSGGALVDFDGKLVGINTAIFSQTGGNIGIGFAIPINLAMQIAEQLLETGQVQRGFFGVTLQNIDAALAEAFNLERNDGAVITSVLKDSPADQAGLKPGDILRKVNGKNVKHADGVRNQLGLLKIGSQVIFDILRGGQPKQISLKVTAVAQQDSQQLMNKAFAGVTLDEIKRQGYAEGIQVVDIQRGSRAWRGGLRKGDIIISVNHQIIKNMQNFFKVIEQIKPPILLRIQRGNGVAFIVIK